MGHLVSHYLLLQDPLRRSSQLSLLGAILMYFLFPSIYGGLYRFVQEGERELGGHSLDEDEGRAGRGSAPDVSVPAQQPVDIY